MGGLASNAKSRRVDAGRNPARVAAGGQVAMPPLAQRNLFHDKVRLTVTLTGIVFAVVLIVVELGLFFGFTVTTSNLIDHAGADLWITSPKVPYVEMGVPFSERKLNQIRGVPGVSDAEKLVAQWTQWKLHDG